MEPHAIRQLRKRLGLNQQQLAEKLGYKTAGSVSRFENGERVPHGPIDRLLFMLQDEALKNNPKN